MNKSENILSDLRSKGYKITPIRVKLIETLLGSPDPLDVLEVMERLNKLNLKPNKTTIYRELEFLKSQVVLQEIEFGEGKKRYEISEDHHHHIICVNCRLIKDIPMEKDLNKQEKKVILEMGFKPIGHSLEFFGLCSKCQ